MEKGKRCREEDEDGSSDIDNSDMEDEERELAIYKYYRAFLPMVKNDVGLEKPDLVRDRTDMACRVCPPGAPKLTGWKGLLVHAQTYKKKLPYKHRAYARALEQVFKENKPDPRAPTDAVRIVQTKLEEKNKETFHRDVKKSKQEHEHQRALFKSQLLEMNQIQEQAAELDARKQQLSSQIKEMEMELEEKRTRSQQQEANYAKEKQRQAARFQQEIRRVDAATSAREEELKMTLERNEKIQAQERLYRLQELKYLSTVLNKLTIKETEVLEREEEALRKRERYEKYMREAIAAFNEKARVREMKAIEEQRREEKKLLEESDARKEKLLDEWLSKQETLRKEIAESKAGPQTMEIDEKATECAKCGAALTSGNRAILRPCGHARTCMECAGLLWKSKKKLCPICKEKMDDKPILAPKKLYL